MPTTARRRARQSPLAQARLGALALLLVAGIASPAGAQRRRAADARSFRIEETTIADVHAAMRAGTLTCHALVDQYIRRIDAYDKRGPGINAIVVVNPDALRVADSLDARVRREGITTPLHCVPMIVKDNFQTTDLPTTAGSLSLAGFVPARDAFMVRRLREAGAVVLAKSNMAEFAFTPYETVSSILPGYTKNPYALDRVTAGSSGGSAAAVAANLGESALGTDTGNSIRGPSSHLALVGIRSTMGLTSRAGVVPLNLAYDIAGPMARTVADAVAIFQVVAGYDADDPVTEAARTHPTPNYAASLVKDGLRGARLGVLRQAYDASTADREVIAVFGRAIADLRRAGAIVLDSMPIPELDSLFKVQTGECNRFKYDLERWIASNGGRTPVKSLDEIVTSRRFHPSIEPRLTYAQKATTPPEQNPACAAIESRRAGFRVAVGRAMDQLGLDAAIYPTWSNVPRLIGDLNTPAGDNSQIFAPGTGWPAVQVPMGYTRGDSLPAGMTIFGRAWSEPTLFKLAFGYEQATHHRKPPATAPPLLQSISRRN
ncbi:MAG: amidase [Gemmatimonadetes bacterium]|nr:MAG: amidase [Gemmatimonadota bacterium]